MGVINAVTLTAMTRNFRAIFFQALEASAETELLKLLAMLVPSTKPIEDYRWLGDVPQMEEWIGERALAGLSQYGFEIKNKKWANGIKVLADEVEDDSLGMVKPRIQQLAAAAASHKVDLVLGLLSDGFTKKAYDGKNFFSATHGFGSNLVTGAFSATKYAKLREQLAKVKNDKDKSLKCRGTHLVHGPALEGIVLEVLTADRDTNGKTNIWKGTAKPLMVQGLKTDTEYYLGDFSKPVKPTVSQERRKTRFRARDNPNDSNVFDLDEFRYGADYRGNAGYALPQLIQGSLGT